MIDARLRPLVEKIWGYHHLDHQPASGSATCKRIRLYAGRGFQIDQEIPDDVWRAYEDLVEAGYDKYLVQD